MSVYLLSPPFTHECIIVGVKSKSNFHVVRRHDQAETQAWLRYLPRRCGAQARQIDLFSGEIPEPSVSKQSNEARIAADAKHLHRVLPKIPKDFPRHYCLFLVPAVVTII